MKPGLDIPGDWHRVGAGLSVRFRLHDGRIDAEWIPRFPTLQEGRSTLDRYREARNLFLADIAQRTGVAVTCVELKP